MLEEKQVRQRLAEYDTQMQKLRAEYLDIWHSPYTQYTGRQYAEIRLEMDGLLGKWQEVAKRKELLQWVLGEIPGHDLVSEDWRVWIKNSQNEDVLQKQYDDAQQGKITTLDSSPAALEQFCYLIRRQLAAIKERRGRIERQDPLDLFSEPVLTDRREMV